MNYSYIYTNMPRSWTRINLPLAIKIIIRSAAIFCCLDVCVKFWLIKIVGGYTKNFRSVNCEKINILPI